MQQHNWRMKQITATGLALRAGEVFGGFVTQAAGTSTTVTAYDDAAAATTANLLIPTTDTTKSNVPGVFISPFGGGVGPLTTAPDPRAGVILQNGLWVVLGGTGSPSIWVLFR